MKQTFRKSLAIILATLMLLTAAPLAGFAGLELDLTAQAASVVNSGTCGENLTWTLDDEGTLTVSGTGDMDDYFYPTDIPWYENQASIKKVVIEDGVTSIGYLAFDRCSELSTVVIPESVTNIEVYAFSQCTSLTSVTIPDSVTHIGRYAFEDCSALSEIIIGDNVTGIGHRVFEDTAYYNDADNWEDNALYIGKHLIKVNNNIGKSYVIKEGTKTVAAMGGIGDHSLLETVTIPVSVTNIGYDAFFGSNLKDVYYSGTENEWSFIEIASSNTMLQNATIHYHVHDFIDGVCSGCGEDEFIATGTCGENLTWTLNDEGTLTISGTGDMHYVQWDSYKSSIKTVIIESGVTSIGYYAFDGCESLTSVIIPDSVTSIEYGAFEDCTALASIVIPDSVTHIDEWAFSGCTALESVVFGENSKLTSIEYRVFADCSALTSIVIPDSVTRIGEQAFSMCAALESVTLSENITIIDTIAFAGVPLKTLHLPANLKTVGGPIVLHANFEGYTVDENNAYLSVDENGNLFNKDKTTLIHHILNPEEKEYTIPETVTTIGSYAFAYDVLEKINIPETVKNISDFAFFGCFMLEEINLPKNLERMGCNALYYAFANKVTIPENVTFSCHHHEGEADPTDNQFQCLNELTVYDRDMDFTGFYAGFLEGTAYRSQEAVELYRSYVASINSAYFLYSFGYGEEPVVPEINEDEIFDRNAEPDLIVETSYDSYELYKIPGFTIRCYEGSTAEAYALQYGFNIKYICDEHSYETVVTAPTCTEQGYTTYTCTTCGDTYVADETTAPGHTAGAAATCTEDQTCTVCGEVLTGKLGHDYKTVVTAPTCTEQGYTTYTCSACGDSYATDYVGATGHNHKATVTKPATHTETGVRTYTCSACGDTYTEVIAKTAKHTYTAEVLEEAECNKAGKMLYICECGDSYTEKIPELGHIDVDDDSNCDRCGIKVCSCMCHQTGFMGFIWKIVKIFWQLFGMNPVCECGKAHY